MGVLGGISLNLEKETTLPYIGMLHAMLLGL
jgi:hypothetical protein